MRRRLAWRAAAVVLALSGAFIVSLPTTTIAQAITRIGGWVTTAAPTYAANTLATLSLDTAGNLRVAESGTSAMSSGVGTTADAASTVGGTGSLNAKARLQTTQLGQIETAVETLVTTGINIDQIGGQDPVFEACRNSETRTAINIAEAAAATTVQFRAPTASTRWYFCGGTLRVSAAATITIISGTGATCGTSTDTFGSWRAATDEFVMNESSDVSLFRVGAVGEGFCVTRSATVALAGSFYVVGVAE